MTQQRDDAASRSAHVARGAAAPGETISPVVETPEGYRLRAVIDAEQRCALLAAKLGELEEERNALRARAERAEAALRTIAGNGDATGCNPQIKVNIALSALAAIPDVPG